MAKQINWEKTINNIVHTHESDKVEFDVSDITLLGSYLSELQENISTLKLKNKLLQNEKDNLSTKLWKYQLSTDNLSTFKIYT